MQFYCWAFFSSAVVHLGNSWRVARLCFCEKRSLPSPSLTFSEWEFCLVGSGNPEVFCHIFFHTFVSVFCPPLTHAIIVPPAIFICGVHTGVYRWEENRFYFVEISILNIYRLSWQSLTKGVIFSKYFVCWMLSYRILLAKY